MGNINLWKQLGDQNILSLYKELNSKVRNEAIDLLHQKQIFITEVNKMNPYILGLWSYIRFSCKDNRIY